MGNNRVLIVGVSGYLGSALALGLREEFETYGTYFSHVTRVEGCTCLRLSALDGTEVFGVIKEIQPDTVIYAAGFPDANYCHMNPNSAEALHFQGAALFFKTMRSYPRFVYISTDQVYGQDAETGIPFSEDKKAAPISVLGKTKMQGELATLTPKRDTFVMRLGMVYGEDLGSPYSPRKSWLCNMDRKLRKGQGASFYKDVVGSPTYVGDVVRAMRVFLRKPPLESQVYHFAGPDALTQYEVAERYCKAMEIPTQNLRGTTLLDEISNKRSGAVLCSRNTALSAKKFEEAYNFRFQGVREGLHELSERLRTGHTGIWT